MDPTSANPHLTLDMFFLQHILSETACHCRYVADPQLHSSLCLLRYADCPTEEGTYEAIGPHFRANPYGLEKDVIEKHGIRILLDVPRDFERIRDYLEKHNIEGIVFWKDGQPQCKIKRSDFGFPWGE